MYTSSGESFGIWVVALVSFIVFQFVLSKFKNGQKILDKLDNFCERLEQSGSNLAEKVNNSAFYKITTALYLKLLKILIVICILIYPSIYAYSLYKDHNIAKDLTESYTNGPFRIWYSTDPKYKLSLSDTNGNFVPDRIEDIATQLTVARMIFHAMYKFPDPLQSKRFQHIQHIDVYVSEKEKLSKRIGIGKRIGGYTHSRTLPITKNQKVERTLKIFVDGTLNQKETVALHEYFHLIQYTMLDSLAYGSWFVEGLAEWSEDSLRNSKDLYSLKKSKQELLELLQSDKLQDSAFAYSLAVSEIWGPFINLCGVKERIVVPERLRYVDGTNPFRDTDFYGAELIRDYMTCTNKKTIDAQRVAKVAQEKRPDSNIAAKMCLYEFIDRCDSDSHDESSE